MPILSPLIFIGIPKPNPIMLFAPYANWWSTGDELRMFKSVVLEKCDEPSLTDELSSSPFTLPLRPPAVGLNMPIGDPL